MMKALKKVNWKKLGIFAGGVLFGTAGIKVLSSKDAKNVYTHCTAGVLRAKDCVMKTANTIQENCGDIRRSKGYQRGKSTEGSRG